MLQVRFIGEQKNATYDNRKNNYEKEDNIITDTDQMDQTLP